MRRGTVKPTRIPFLAVLLLAVLIPLPAVARFAVT